MVIATSAFATPRSSVSTTRPCTTEAASLQEPDAFWWFVDSIYGDLGHQDDPHLWQRVSERGLDLERFERDRRSDEVTQRIRADFESGIRAGVTGTPALFTP